MVIGVPTFAVIYALCRRRINRNLKKKNLPTENSEHGCNDIRILTTFFDDPDKCCYKYCQVRQQTDRTNSDKKLQVFIVGAVENLMVYIGHNIHVVIISDKTEGVRPVSKQFVDR